MICHYWVFNDRLKFQDSLCNDCHDLTMLSVNISDIIIITVKKVDYGCIIHNISKTKDLEDHGYIYIYTYIHTYIYIYIYIYTYIYIYIYI